MFLAGTTALEVIQSLGLHVSMEWPPEPVLTERDRLMQRLLCALRGELDERYDWLERVNW